MNSEYVCAAEHVSQVCIDNSEEYLPLHEVFVGHNTLSYLEEEDGLSATPALTPMDWRKQLEFFQISLLSCNVKSASLWIQWQRFELKVA